MKLPSASGINGASSPKYRSLRNSIIACIAVSFNGTIRLLEAAFSLPTTISRPLFLLFRQKETVTVAVTVSFRYGEYPDPKHFSAKIFSVPHRKL